MSVRRAGLVPLVLVSLLFAGLSGVGVGGGGLPGRSLRGALFLSHWLVVVPMALVRIALGPATTTFRRKTPAVLSTCGNAAHSSSKTSCEKKVIWPL